MITIAVAIYFAGIFFLAAAVLRYPLSPWGDNAALPISGCREMGWAVLWKYFSYYCLLLLAVFPFWGLWSGWRRRSLWLVLPVLMLAGELLLNTAVYSAFRYRMELRERYGKDEKGYLAVERLMPPEIKREYQCPMVTAKTRMVALFFGWMPLTIWGIAVLYIAGWRVEAAPELPDVSSAGSSLPSGSREGRG
ncbi:MAG: hypothetical protein AB7F32_02530 [Victivallaceae bacterium]